jgi:acyl-CoA thioesterase FadM
MGVRLTVRGKVREVKGRKVVVDAELFAESELCARGEVIAVRVPEHMVPGKKES